MSSCTVSIQSATRASARGALAIAVAIAAIAAQPAQAHDRGQRVTPPVVPASIAVEDGNKAVLVGHATGTQNYVCLPSGSGFAWTLFTPQATLFSGGEKQLITHFFSPNPDENSTVRAAWQDSRDASTVWAQAFAPPLTDPAFVAPGAVAWLLLKVVGKQEGPRRGDALTETTFIHRVNTQGGLAPSTGCSVAANVGAKAFMPYTADYFFYEKEDDDRDY